MAALIKTLMVVPETDNDGVPFPASLWDELERRLLAFGGYTRLADSTGAWVSGARVYRDRNRRYEVGLGSWADFSTWFGIAAWARESFRQEALYIEVAGTPEIIGG